MPTSVSSRRSQRSCSISSTSFSTSGITSSTIWGPGEAIEAFDKATLRGIDDVIIRHRLTALCSLFPHGDDTAIEDVDSVYKDVLEFSREKLYSKNVNQAALQLILMQIASRQTHHMRKGLQRWPAIEQGIFLSQVMKTIMLGYEKWYETLCSEKRTTTAGDGNDLVPMIDFIALVVDHDRAVCQDVFNGGFLDMLLKVYIFCPKLERDTSTLANACTSALLVLSRQPQNLDAIMNHPVCTLWETCREVFDITAMLDDPVSSRCAAWRRTGKSSVISRLVIIYKVLLSKSHLEKPVAADMCIDLIEFSRSLFYDTEVVELAILTILRCILIGGLSPKRLAVALTNASYQDVVNIFSRIIRLWVAYVQTRDKPEMALQHQAHNKGHSGADQNGGVRPPTQYAQSIEINKSFYDRERALLFCKIKTIQCRALPPDDRPLHNVMGFAMTIAKHSLISRWGILDAGILVFVPLAAVDGLEPLLSPLLDALGMHTNRDTRSSQKNPHSRTETSACDLNPPAFPFAAVRSAASKLLSLIQGPMFQELLHSEIFITRRSICLALVHTFLGNGYGILDIYSEIRAVFTQILVEGDVPIAHSVMSDNLDSRRPHGIDINLTTVPHKFKF